MTTPDRNQLYYERLPRVAIAELKPHLQKLLTVMMTLRTSRELMATNKEIAAAYGCSEGNTRRQIQALEETGWIVRRKLGDFRVIEFPFTLKGEQTTPVQTDVQRAPSMQKPLIGRPEGARAGRAGGVRARRAGGRAPGAHPKQRKLFDEPGVTESPPLKRRETEDESVAFAGAPAREGTAGAEPTQRESSTLSDPETEGTNTPAVATVETEAQRETAVRVAWNQLSESDRATRLATVQAAHPSLRRATVIVQGIALEAFEKERPDLFPPFPPRPAWNPAPKPALQFPTLTPKERTIRAMNATERLLEPSSRDELAREIAALLKDEQSVGYHRARLADIAEGRVKPSFAVAALKAALAPGAARPGAVYAAKWAELRNSNR